MSTTELRLRAIELGHSDPNPWVKVFARWLATARPDQLAPGGDWLVWFLMGGRGAGKTRTGAEHVTRRLMRDGYRRWGCIARTAEHVRNEIVEGPGGLLACAPPDDGRPDYQPSKKRVVYPNGAVAYLYSAEEPDSLRGPQHDGLWCFIAGTAIRMADGSEQVIEELQPGAAVMTHLGPRPVLAVGTRVAPLMELRYGADVLVGTGDHPVWTQAGWKSMSALSLSDTLCLWSDDGSPTSRDTGSATTEDGSSTNTGRSGLQRMGPSHEGTTSTIATVAGQTTGLPTWSWLRPWPTVPTIQFPGPAVPALSVEQGLRQRRTVLPPSTVPSSAGSERVSASEYSPSGPVLSVADPTGAERPGSAVSGVSILGVAGRVYNLQVADSRTYFANGVLVHNCDEIAVWADAHRGDALDTTWNNALLGLRLGKRPEVVATSTPRRVKLVQELLKNPKCVVTHATTYDNLANLTPVFKELILGKYEGTRLEGQEIKGKLLEDVEGALWTEGIILRGPRPELARVVVAVDPSGSKTGDEIGIVGAGRTLDSGYVLEDRSGHYSPEGWGRAVVNLYHDLQADKVIAEANYGGEMVAHVIRTVDLTVPVKIIHASRGKAVRAEPVAAMYEQGKWTHCGVFPLLEDEMTTWTPDDPTSPNRLDALVWCGHELFLEKRRARALG